MTRLFRAMVRADLVVLMAGPAAECRFADQPDREHDGIYGDLLQAQEMADEFLFSPEPIVQAQAEETARQLVSECWPAITAVAQALIRVRTLPGDMVREIVGQTLEGFIEGEKWITGGD